MAKKLLRILLPLLIIPLALAADLLILWLGSLADTALFAGADAVGHPIPVFTVIAMLICAVISIAALVLTIVLVVTGIAAAVRKDGE